MSLRTRTSAIKDRVWLDGAEVEHVTVHNVREGWLLTSEQIPGKEWQAEAHGRLYLYHGTVRVETINRWEGKLRAVVFDSKYIEIEIDTGIRGQEWRFQFRRDPYPTDQTKVRPTLYQHVFAQREHLIACLDGPCVIERTYGMGPPSLDDGYAGDFVITVAGQRIN